MRQVDRRDPFVPIPPSIIVEHLDQPAPSRVALRSVPRLISIDVRSVHVFETYLLGPVLLLVTVAIGYPAYWLYAASLSESLLQNWIEEQRSNGFTVNHRPVERSGFPLVIRLTLPALEASNAEMGFSWRSEKLQLELQPWDLRRLRLDALGPQQVQFKPSQDIANFTANTTGFSGVAVIGNSGALTALSIVLKEVRLTESEQGQLMQSGRILADIRRPEKPIAHTEPAFEISLAAEHINTATVKAPILGDTIANIRVKAEFLGPLDGDTLINAVSSWRQSGGTVEVHWLNLIWGASICAPTVQSHSIRNCGHSAR